MFTHLQTDARQAAVKAALAQLAEIEFENDVGSRVQELTVTITLDEHGAEYSFVHVADGVPRNGGSL